LIKSKVNISVRILQTMVAFSGNAPPQLAVTRKLLARGHEVTVLAHRAARGRVQATGAGFLEFKRTVPDMDLTRRETDSLRDWRSHTRLGQSLRLVKNGVMPFVLAPARDCAEALQSHPADVVVLDWMLTGAAVAAEGAGVPAVVLVHCPYPFPREGVPPLFSGLGPGDGPLMALRDRLLSRFSTRVSAFGLPLLNKARHEQGLAPLEDWASQLLSTREVCMMTAPELDFCGRGTLPENVRYVGPAFEPYPREWISPWPETNEDPLVVVSFSTSYMNQGVLAQRVLDALAGLPVRALLTCGPALDVERLELPANARRVDFLPHRTVLPHAALLITHAGWQTINAGLAEGVPLLCIPGGRDQPDNAVRVLACGAGLRVSKNASRRRLRHLIAQALVDPGLRLGAERMALALARRDGAVTVAETIERLAPATRVAIS
jgi:MGT family glycosyltransferase